MRLAIWSTTTPRQNSTHEELFRRQLDEIELAERIGIDQVWFYEHHLNPSAPVPSPNLLIAAAAQRTGRIRFASMVNILPFRNPLLVSAQSEDSLRWAAQYDIPFAQIDSVVEQARRDQALYREVQIAHGHKPAPRLYLMREIYVGESDRQARAEARPYLLQYWELWNRYTQFTDGGQLPDSYDFWQRQAPMLHAMDFDQIVA